MFNTSINNTADKKVFVAMTDELLYENPDKIDGPLVPYSTSHECHHWLSIEINPEDIEPLDEPLSLAAG